MAKSIKIRAKESGGITTVKALMTHPMETGARKDSKTGKLIPAHFIQEVTCQHKGNTVMTAQWSGGISKNPYISFKFSGGAKGDELELTWKDNKDKSDSMTSTIK
ncbi:MAG: thiosulfate oxidation carrier complex protein SoxZ [Candidatus Thiodiazotropha sp. (ex Dulcina madagascariensis)]|nr:thiosulfate oxidation carrier complex protein SoxZ [Candidatus Thiodiazotropha sp. (ex Dulcina madagascariensis)]MCU7926424.1 thiosulfate oxidation carrier complex protein SoxZ [Candidatus Thiodiazotropha sp. (ex Dulcina madagascariensis)]